MTPQTALGDVKAEPFRIDTASGRTCDIRHPEMVKVLRSRPLAVSPTGEAADIPDEWQGVSLTPTESLSHLETQVA